MIRAIVALVLSAASSKPAAPAFTDLTFYKIAIVDSKGRDVERMLTRFDDPEKGVTCYVISPEGAQWLFSCTKTSEARQ